MTPARPLSPSEAAYRQDVGAGLVLRWSTAADLERLSTLYGAVFGQEPDASIQSQLHDLMSDRHPLIASTDFALVEDAAGGAVVAAACLMTQPWRYDGIPLPVGRPELVAVAPAYRRRGLMRAIFALLHARSLARGELALGITGIPHYFRQFGYEYALDLGGGPAIALAALRPQEGVPASYTLRPATVDDIPSLVALHARQSADLAVTTTIDAAYWRWQLEGMAHAATERWDVQMILSSGDAAEVPQGYVATARGRPLLEDDDLEVLGLAVAPDAPLPMLVPALLRLLGRRPPAPPAHLVFTLGRAHPVYALLGPHLAPTLRRRYAWYVHVPDLARLLRQVAPALERRLAASPAAGYSGAVCLDCYRSGLRLALEQGRLTAIVDGPRPAEGAAHAGIPALVFLQLLWGYRSLDALCDIYPDVWTADDTAHAVLDGLFPARATWVPYLD